MPDLNSDDMAACMQDWDCVGDTAVFRVGVGSGKDDRRDALRVMKSGKVLVNGEEVQTKGIITTNGRLGDGAVRRLDDASPAHAELKAELNAAKAKIADLEAKQREMEAMIAAIAVHFDRVMEHPHPLK